MTEKISAGYFDSNRGEPIYVGDVYKEDGAMIPYHKVIKDPEKGFMVEHVGTVEKFSLISEAKNLMKKTYLGNIYDTPDWDELVGNKPTEAENKEVPEDVKENLPEDVKEFLQGETDKLPEGTETISTAEAEELEKQAKEIEKTEKNRVLAYAEKLEQETANEENSETEPEETGDEVVSAAATTGPKDEPKAEEKKEDSTEPQSKEKDTQSTPIDVIASNKEEKNLQEKRNDYQKHIDALKRKNDELETEAVRYENLASTLTFEPFVELKMLTSNAVQDYAKKQDIKECEKHLKNYKTIDSIESLLKEYEDMAEKNRSNIELNNKDIDNYEVKIAEINDKLNNFQRKLALDTPADNSAELEGETVKNDKAADEAKTENSQPEPDSNTVSKTDTQTGDEQLTDEEVPF